MKRSLFFPPHLDPGIPLSSSHNHCIHTVAYAKHLTSKNRVAPMVYRSCDMHALEMLLLKTIRLDQIPRFVHPKSICFPEVITRFLLSIP